MKTICLCPTGGQSDQGYGSKDELHQEQVDLAQSAAPLIDVDHRSKPKAQHNGNQIGHFQNINASLI